MKKNNVLSTMLCLAIGGASGCYGSESESKETVNIATGSEIESVMDDAPEVPIYTPWASVYEVSRECYGWKYGLANGNDLSFKYIKGRIEATANEGIDSNDLPKIENAIYKLYNAAGCIDSEGIICELKKITNNSPVELEIEANRGCRFSKQLVKTNVSLKDFEKNVSNLLEIVRDRHVKLVEKIISNSDEHEMKDFIRFVVYKTSLHNGRYDFKSVAGEMIDLYECTKSDKVRNLIGDELKKFGNADDKYFGPEGDKMKEFSDSLGEILAE